MTKISHKKAGSCNYVNRLAEFVTLFLCFLQNCQKNRKKYQNCARNDKKRTLFTKKLQKILPLGRLMVTFFCLPSIPLDHLRKGANPKIPLLTIFLSLTPKQLTNFNPTQIQTIFTPSAQVQPIMRAPILRSHAI